MAFSDIIATSVGPINKLIDAATGAIGKVYEPRYIRKMAEARAHEIKLISEEIRNNSDIPIVFSGTDISIDTSNYEALAQRAGKRLAYQEIAKQENIESVLDNACEELLGKEVKSNENVSKDWMMRFINSVEDISDEEMQKIWGKILAGEIIEPHSFSYKTLDCMRNLSNRDARLFEKICHVVIEGSFIIHDVGILDRFGVTYNDLLILDECGLVNSSVLTAKKETREKRVCIIDFGEYVLMGESESDNSGVNLAIYRFLLTKSGQEIYSILKTNNPFEYIKQVSELIKKQNKSIKISLNKIRSRDEDEIEYDENDLLIEE